MLMLDKGKKILPSDKGQKSITIGQMTKKILSLNFEQNHNLDLYLSITNIIALEIHNFINNFIIFNTIIISKLLS